MCIAARACRNSRVLISTATIRLESSGALRVKDGAVTWQQELARTPLHLVAFGETDSGELLLVDHDRTHQIYRLTPYKALESQRKFPRRLSESGLFESVREGTPARGVLRYEINSSLWSDGATAERLLGIPGMAKIGLDAQGTWQFPEGSVLVRTVSLELEPGKPASRRKVETQVLHLEAGAWRPYSYQWNEGQDDAALVGARGVFHDQGRRWTGTALSDPRAVGMCLVPQSLG